MRLFTAVELDERARYGAATVLDELRARAARSAPRARVTWVPADRVHLTVRFIGEVDEVLAARTIGALRNLLPVAPFVMTFDRLGAFPAKGPPRVFWIGVGDGRDEIVRVEAAISARLEAIGIPREDRPYSPHLTLGRVREAGGLRPSRLFEGIAPNLVPTQVAAITLFQSRLSPKGPTYTVLERTRLQAPDYGLQEA